jgi:magnesium-transporting ATPase (P-type)
MNKANRILAIICFLLGVLLLWSIPMQIPHIGDRSRQILTADAFPRFVGFLLIISSIGLFIQAQIGILYDTETESAPDFNLKKGKKVFVTFGFILAYAVLLPQLGFLIASIGFCYLYLFYMRVKKWWYYVIITILIVIIYVIFTKFLYIFLPTFRRIR